MFMELFSTSSMTVVTTKFNISGCFWKIARGYTTYYLSKTNIELQSTRRRSLAELSSILSLLEQKERRASSKKVRTELRRTRQRLERYGQVRYGDLIDQEATDDQRQFKAEEKEMYDVLERIIQRLVQKHQVDVDTTTTVDKRSAETPARRTTEERLMKLFRLWNWLVWLFIVDSQRLILSCSRSITAFALPIKRVLSHPTSEFWPC